MCNVHGFNYVKIWKKHQMIKTLCQALKEKEKLMHDEMLIHDVYANIL